MNNFPPLKPSNISTHAPHAGSDSNSTTSSNAVLDFNPRSPCGERLSLGAQVLGARAISTHAPHAGSDLILDSRR